MDLQQIINPKQKLQEQSCHTIQKLSLQIESKHQIYKSQNGTLSINSEHFQFIFNGQTESHTQMSDSIKIVYVNFSNVSSIGISGQSICIFLQSQNQEDQQCDLEEPEKQQQIKNESVITLLKQSKSGNFNITGNLTIKIGFQNYNNSVLKQVHDILIEKLESAQSSDDQQNNLMGQMINADSINEDGTINMQKLIKQSKVNESAQSSSQQEEQQSQIK